jgi:cellulose biosynthesis protein BcsQ
VIFPMTTGIGMVITFYSWKGGVGRTMALANTAVQLARKGNRVLMVDWDLEAPGLINYFAGRVAQQTKDLGIGPAKYSRGLLGLLSDALSGGDKDGSAWKAALRTVTISPDSPTHRNPTPPQPGQLDLLPPCGELASAGLFAEGFTPKASRPSRRPLLVRRASAGGYSYH